MAETASQSAAKRPAMKSDKIPSQTQRATSALREMIVNNRLPAGSSYLETELAEMLGMSRTPVREAAVVLESLGLVEVRPRRGIRILPLSSHDMEEIYEVLTELEGLAAEQAARRGLTEGDICRDVDTPEIMVATLDAPDKSVVSPTAEQGIPQAIPKGLVLSAPSPRWQAEVVEDKTEREKLEVPYLNVL